MCNYQEESEKESNNPQSIIIIHPTPCHFQCLHMNILIFFYFKSSQFDSNITGGLIKFIFFLVAKKTNNEGGGNDIINKIFILMS